MVLDIESFRAQEDPEALGPDGVRDIQEKRFKNVEVVQEISDVDQEWRTTSFKVDMYNKAKNVISKTIGMKMKAKEGLGDTDELDAAILTMLKDSPGDIKTDTVSGLCVKQLKALSAKVDENKVSCNEEMQTLEAKRDSLLRSVGNVLHESVPVHSDEDFNEIVRTVGDAAKNKTKKQYSHVDLIEMIDGVESERGGVAAGARCYYLKGPAVCLEQALINFSMQFLMDRDFTAVSPPLFMRKEVMQEVAQLSQFDEELYKVTGKASEREEDAEVEEKYLIATSEQPIAAFHRKEWLDPSELPKQYIGISECFRQEVGSHGRDTLGIFRVHRFKKVEQFVVCSPHDGESWKKMEEMLDNAETFLKAIGLPYQVVNIVSGALNLAAAKKNDVEAWFPGSGAFRELVSCSNCTDYQSRRLKIRYGKTKKINAKTEYVHMLNSTLCATTRVICCILENFQVGDLESNGGIVVPEVLRPFMPQSESSRLLLVVAFDEHLSLKVNLTLFGTVAFVFRVEYREFIPFVKPAPVDELAKAAAAKKGDKKGGKKGKKAAK
eukprot:TRINITY_DN10606_c0_g2_i1.p1 TRINITY_DN10606_c0_g2~~TRINITY_DN10606_c0_g2_i1.p1  ORF type:complete len:551 (+),score=163.73 TRINITY_DN10606_c0_g2_i1:99-1751(+)